MGEARLPEMHLRVDGARQHRETAGGEAMRRFGIREVAEGSDSALSDAEIGLYGTVHGPDRATHHCQVKWHRQVEEIFHPGEIFRDQGKVRPDV
jgi:hypothetical protein